MSQCAVRSKQCAVHSSRFLRKESFGPVHSQVTVFLFCVFVFTVHSLNAQHARLNPNPPYRWEQVLNEANQEWYHTAVRPMVGRIKPDSVRGDHGYRVWTEGRLSWKGVYQKRSINEWHEDSTIDGHAFAIFPIYQAEAGYDLKADRILMNSTLGFVAGGDFKRKLGYEFRVASGITTLPNYQDSLATHFGFVPGWGDRAYPKGNAQYGFQHFSGNVIWRPHPVFNLQVGRDKHFWGDGHRSLFLGDQGPAFPYLKMQTTIWKLQYTSLFAMLQHWEDSLGTGKDYRNKFGSFHYLSFNAAKWLNISVFEAVVWQGTDDNRARGFDPNYLNPLIFFRPVEYSLGSSDNAMLGIAGKIRFNRNNVLYGQIVLDEFYLKEIKNWSAGWWANKQGVQIGYKCYNIGFVENLLMQMEVNIVRPYTYSHGSPQQSYSNGPLPLAHPMGANFSEFIGILSYYYKGMTLTGKLVGIRYGADINDTMNYGQNVFQSYITRENDYGNELWQGCATNVFLAQFTASYVFNTRFPLRIQLTAIARSEKTKWNDPALGSLERKLKSSVVMAGLSLPLWRAQNDY